eukprot:GHVR01058152.1.p1 GENE.GHVR01058152.1~~GHVR01058152.1.p1  ORF type:complete len:182 (+),score=29.02 GHVR01058152.1:127-672(+)
MQSLTPRSPAKVATCTLHYLYYELLMHTVRKCQWDYYSSSCMMEEIGYPLGRQIVERLTVHRPRLSDVKNCLKFVCKDLWMYVLGKNADRLQTNRKGGFVIQETSLAWLQYFSCVDPAVKLPSMNIGAGQMAVVMSSLLAGIVRGSLTGLGVSCDVRVDPAPPPLCVLQVKIFPTVGMSNS